MMRRSGAKVPAIDKIVCTHLRAQFLPGAPRRPIIIEHHRVTQPRRSLTNQFKECIGCHAEIDPLAALCAPNSNPQRVELLRILNSARRAGNCPRGELGYYKEHTDRIRASIS